MTDLADLDRLMDSLDGWEPMSTAPRDGTRLMLTWVENGKPQEVYGGMVWNRFASNPLVQDGKGIWAYHAKNGEILHTWTEEDPEGSPTHWRIDHD